VVKVEWNTSVNFTLAPENLNQWSEKNDFGFLENSSPVLNYMSNIMIESALANLERLFEVNAEFVKVGDGVDVLKIGSTVIFK
jgi:hypothetical protein